MTRRVINRNKKEDEFLDEIEDVIDSPDEEAEQKKIKKKLKRENLLSCGSALLNLASTDCVYGAFLKGTANIVVGASGAGKTWSALSSFAESTLHSDFKHYKIIYDAPEGGAEMDMGYYFGEKTAERIEQPEPDRVDKNDCPQPHSITVEQFYDSLSRHLQRAEDNGYGIIYAVDSMDALTTEAELKKSAADMILREKEKETGGSYGDGKAKVNSQNFRRVTSRLKKSGSILLIVCQERDDIGAMHGGKTFSGGKSLRFYSHQLLWFRKYKDIKVSIDGCEIIIGTLSNVKFDKNRLSGRKHKAVPIAIHDDFGIDDVGSIIDWLIAMKYWQGGKSSTSKIIAEDFGVEMKRENLIRHIQNNNLTEELYEIIQEKWNSIKRQISDKVQRKSRYI